MWLPILLVVPVYLTGMQLVWSSPILNSRAIDPLDMLVVRQTGKMVYSLFDFAP